MSAETTELSEVESRLGYRFRDHQALIDALTHSSAVGHGLPRIAERLEFLGDAVVGLIFSDWLSQVHPDADEGQLSKYRATLINTASLAAKARELGLDQVLRLGKGEERTRGREKLSILAATYEAVVGAVFCEGGYEAARLLVHAHFGDAAERVGEIETPDPKTELQELCQAMCKRAPVYRVVREEGPDHERRFWIEAVLDETVLATGEGSSKRNAEQDAALRALQSSRALIASLGEQATG